MSNTLQKIASSVTNYCKFTFTDHSVKTMWGYSSPFCHEIIKLNGRMNEGIHNLITTCWDNSLWKAMYLCIKTGHKMKGSFSDIMSKISYGTLGLSGSLLARIGFVIGNILMSLCYSFVDPRPFGDIEMKEKKKKEEAFVSQEISQSNDSIELDQELGAEIDEDDEDVVDDNYLVGQNLEVQQITQELTEREKKLQALEKDLEAKTKRLNEREEELNKREQEFIETASECHKLYMEEDSDSDSDDPEKNEDSTGESIVNCVQSIVKLFERLQSTTKNI